MLCVLFIEQMKQLIIVYCGFISVFITNVLVQDDLESIVDAPSSLAVKVENDANSRLYCIDDMI